jgi:hypothetical protein
MAIRRTLDTQTTCSIVASPTLTPMDVKPASPAAGVVLPLVQMSRRISRTRRCLKFRYRVPPKRFWTEAKNSQSFIEVVRGGVRSSFCSSPNSFTSEREQAQSTLPALKPRRKSRAASGAVSIACGFCNRCNLPQVPDMLKACLARKRNDGVVPQRRAKLTEWLPEMHSLVG